MGSNWDDVTRNERIQFIEAVRTLTIQHHDLTGNWPTADQIYLRLKFERLQSLEPVPARIGTR